jgi:hypothetical protein
MREAMVMGEHARRIASTVYRETSSGTAASWAGLLALIIEELVGSGCSCGAPWRKGLITDTKTGKTGLGVMCTTCGTVIPLMM